MKPSGLLSFFTLFVEKGADEGYSTWKLFIIVPLAMQNPLVFRQGPLEVVGNVKLVRIESIWIVNLLIVDAHFNIGKNWTQILFKRVTREKRTSSSSSAVASSFAFASFCALSYFLWYCNFSNRNSRKVSVSTLKTLVSNQRNNRVPFEIHILCIFQRVR